MKSIPLIRLNALKILSIIGYIMLFMLDYFELMAIPLAHKIDIQTGCNPFPDSSMCEINYTTLYFLFVYLGFTVLGLISAIISALEFLYLKFIKKKYGEIIYKPVWVILFWFGLFLYCSFLLTALYFIIVYG